ncbi:MAG: hypothetical protein HLUCCA12_09000 [Rhodobacteraceae bacterium HLUCCA12]|nr:MAG: hypothetical protein HLUCCA12_09000 [Rhodobacteraceae bacterium HLUCCA12]
MRTVCLTLATALALTGTAALSDAKPADGKPDEPRAGKLVNADAGAADAEANVIDASTLPEARDKAAKVTAQGDVGDVETRDRGAK